MDAGIVGVVLFIGGAVGALWIAYLTGFHAGRDVGRAESDRMWRQSYNSLWMQSYGGDDGGVDEAKGPDGIYGDPDPDIMDDPWDSLPPEAQDEFDRRIRDDLQSGNFTREAQDALGWSNPCWMCGHGYGRHNQGLECDALIPDGGEYQICYCTKFVHREMA